MEKNDILNIINKLSKYKFKWSEPITDNKYLEEKGIHDVKGYGIYDAKAENRYCLCIDIPNPPNKSLTTLLMNPSKTFPTNIAEKRKIKSRFDQTIRNLIRLAGVNGFGQVIVLNTFPFIEGNSTEANKYAHRNKKLNSDFIEKVLNDSTEILVACGDNVEEELYNEYFKIITNIKGNQILYTYTCGNNKFSGLTTKGRPRHLSLQSESNRVLYNNALRNKKLFELDIEKNYFILKSL